MSRVERAPTQSHRVVEELLRLHLLAAPSDPKSQVGRRGQRTLVLCAEQAGHMDENLALDFHGTSVLALL